MFVQAKDKDDDAEKDKDSKGSSSGKMNKKRQPFFKRKSKEKVGRRISEPVGPNDRWEHKPVKRNSEDRILHADRGGLDLGKCRVYSLMAVFHLTVSHRDLAYFSIFWVELMTSTRTLRYVTILHDTVKVESSV